MRITKEFREYVKREHNFSSTSKDESSKNPDDWCWYIKVDYPMEVCMAIDHSEEFFKEDEELEPIEHFMNIGVRRETIKALYTLFEHEEELKLINKGIAMLTCPSCGKGLTVDDSSKVVGGLCGVGCDCGK